MSKTDFYLSFKDSADKLKSTGKEFAEFFKHGTLVVELYNPHKADKQKPHLRDEVYIVTSGSGRFFCGGESVDFVQGDFLFAPAGFEHRFEKFTDDFITWVLFYGPERGEKNV